jgi:hypothetical protein
MATIRNFDASCIKSCISWIHEATIHTIWRSFSVLAVITYLSYQLGSILSQHHHKRQQGACGGCPELGVAVKWPKHVRACVFGGKIGWDASVFGNFQFLSLFTFSEISFSKISFSDLKIVSAIPA